MQALKRKIDSVPCRCVFCGEEKAAARMHALQKGRAPKSLVGICKGCCSRLGVRR